MTTVDKSDYHGAILTLCVGLCSLIGIAVLDNLRYSHLDVKTCSLMILGTGSLPVVFLSGLYLYDAKKFRVRAWIVMLVVAVSVFLIAIFPGRGREAVYMLMRSSEETQMVTNQNDDSKDRGWSEAVLKIKDS